MIVYHGSNIAIEAIDLAKCRPNRDFGRGFYVTKFRRHAENMAKSMGRKHNSEGVVTEFEYHESAFTRHICKIKHFEKYDEDWLDFVVLNRNKNSPQPAHEFDIVESPVANDKIQKRIDNFLRGEITKSDFLEELKWHAETHQICFCTDGSLQTLDQKDCGKQDSILLHIGEPIVEKLVLDFGFDDQAAAEKFFLSATFIKLQDASTGLYEKPWTEIYELLKTELAQNKEPLGTRQQKQGD